MTFPKRQNYSDGKTNQRVSQVEMEYSVTLKTEHEGVFLGGWSMELFLNVVCGDGNTNLYMCQNS